MREKNSPGRERLTRLSFFTGGLLSILVQAVVLRESLFGIHRAELASGIVLASWIAGSGAGAALAGRTSRNRLFWIVGVILLPLLGIAQVALSRSGILPLAVTVLPVGFVAGVIFIQPFAYDRPGSIYALEALGAAAGGCVFMILSPHLLALEMLAVAIVVSAIALFSCGSRWAGSLVALLISASAAVSLPGSASSALGRMAFGDYDTARVHASPYGEVVAVSREGQHAVYRSGLLEASWPSVESAEATVIVPLAAALPETVLYIGSSPGQTDLICQWPTVEHLVTVVPDGRLYQLADYAGERLSGDGRNVLSGCNERFDLIMVVTGEPLTLLANRFYTSEFMNILGERLTDDGIAAIHLGGGANRLHPLEADLAASILSAARGSFSWSRFLPLSGLILMAGRGQQPPMEGEVIASRLDSLGFHGLYINSGTVPFELSAFRDAQFTGLIDSAHAEMNRDLHPEGFIIAHEMWNIRMGDAGGTGLAVPIAVLCLLLMVLASVLTGRKLSSLGVASAGFAGLAVETISIVAVQASTGYSWVLVGAITGIFMTGGALGAFFIHRDILRNTAGILAISAAAAMTCSVALHLYDTGTLSGTMLSLFLLTGTFACGFASGGIFPSVAEGLARGGIGKIGLLDLAEHGGSAAACLLMPLVLFPLVGAAHSLMVASAWVAVWAGIEALKGRG